MRDEKVYQWYNPDWDIMGICEDFFIFLHVRNFSLKTKIRNNFLLRYQKLKDAYNPVSLGTLILTFPLLNATYSI